MTAAALPVPVLRWLAAAVFLAAASHAGHLPFWVTALVPAALLLRLGLGRPPARWLLILLVLLACAAVLAHFRTIAGTTAGGAFLATMVALKFLEARDERDAGLLICLAYFLATSVFLTSQSMGMAVWVLGSVGITTVSLMTLAAPSGPPVGLRLRQTGLLFAQATPVMLVLFLLFPRIPEPLWGLGEREDVARTGLSDTMSPGSVTQLTQSSETAFRAQFSGDSPPAEPYYWRGPVFWNYDGGIWSRGERAARSLPRAEVTGRTVEYTMLIAPHGRRWLFALDLPLGSNVDHGVTAGHNLLSENAVDEVRGYRARSALHYRLEPELPPARRERALALPPDAAPLARELAARWRAQSSGPREVVEHALRHFHEREFHYTLSPPEIGEEPVDDFLFRTQSGFCEHYASAFTVLMRAAGIPARVVTGYLGGETNELGDYMIVRQSDAHAWSEVWLPERGWTRVDPTDAVARERVESGVASLPNAEENLPEGSYREGWLKRLSLAWDAVDHSWNRFVLGYGPSLQERLLSGIGLGNLGQYALSLLAAAAAAAAIAGVWLLSLRRAPPADPVVRAWTRATARLRRAGIEPDPREGPRALAARVRRARPDLAPAFGRIARGYIALRYRPAPPPDALRRLRREVRRFRPR